MAVFSEFIHLDRSCTILWVIFHKRRSSIADFFHDLRGLPLPWQPDTSIWVHLLMWSFMVWRSGRTISQTFSDPTVRLGISPLSWQKFTRNCHDKKSKLSFTTGCALPNTNTYNSEVFFLRHHLTISWHNWGSSTINIRIPSNTIFEQLSRDYTVCYPVPGVTFCEKQVHHEKVVTQELSDQSLLK